MIAYLLGLPERRLAHGFLVTRNGEACAIGVYALGKGLALKRYVDREDENGEHTIKIGRKAGLQKSLAEYLAWMNDETYSERYTPEQRWLGIYQWCCE